MHLAQERICSRGSEGFHFLYLHLAVCAWKSGYIFIRSGRPGPEVWIYLNFFGYLRRKSGYIGPRLSWPGIRHLCLLLLLLFSDRFCKDWPDAVPDILSHDFGPFNVWMDTIVLIQVILTGDSF